MEKFELSKEFLKEVPPEFLDVLNYTFLTVPLYQIAFSFLVFIFVLLLRKIFILTIVKSVKIFVGKTKTDKDDKLLEAVTKPMNFLFFILALYASATVLDMQKHTNLFIHSLTTFTIFWVMYNLIKVFEKSIMRLFGKKLSYEIGLFLIKALRVFVISLGAVAVLQTLGINVSAFIASLGLGGLAFALAAKDTAANLFGGFAILTDNIFKIGDWVKIDGVEGIVEDIGMRTTKIRAFDKRLVVVPNATIANSAVDNFSRRDRRRIKMRIGLTYATNPKMMQKILIEIRTMLQNHPQIHKDPMFVYFDEFGASSLDLFFYLFTTTSNWEEYLKIREDINLKIIDIVQRNGSDFAFPSQSVYFENELALQKVTH